MGPKIKQLRDVTVIDLAEGPLLVVACDSLGAIGPKENDLVRVPGYVVGRLTSRVGLLEVMSTGARPLVLINALAVEMSPTGEEIIAGIKDEVAGVGLEGDLVITGSTEENVPTRETGMGLTVIGAVERENFRVGSSMPGQLIACIGVPKVGAEVSLDDPETVDLLLLKTLLELDYVSDIIPVGSKGIGYEAGVLAATAGLKAAFDTRLDLEKSAGPATCLLTSLWPDKLEDLARAVDRPVAAVGRLIGG
ncbi:MAG: AIR synthase related protein [Limnochordia bacterium]|jgi:hypothetical protein|nr:hypothetical protein [Bacillota bacterium]